MRWGNRFLTWVTNVLYGLQLQDMETCYKMMTLDVARSLCLQAERFDIEPEITAQIASAGYRIAQIPIHYAPRTAKKLNPWRDGLPALWTLIKYRFAMGIRQLQNRLGAITYVDTEEEPSR